jgi:hypothetical protein
MKSEDLHRLKASLQLKGDIEACITGEGRMWDDVRKVIDKLPAQQFINAIQYLEKQVLPGIKKKSGESSPDYKFFMEIIDLLQWGVLVYERCKRVQQMYGTLNLENTLLRERVAVYERELNKYSALEDIFLVDSLEHIEKGIMHRLESKLGSKKG